MSLIPLGKLLSREWSEGQLLASKPTNSVTNDRTKDMVFYPECEKITGHRELKVEEIFDKMCET